MVRLLPFSFLIVIASLFGIAWVVTGSDPESAAWYVFTVFVALIFLFLFNILGLILYLLRTRFYRRFSERWYFYTSYKMAFFVAIFVTIASVLAILDLVSTINVFLAIIAVVLFAVWSFLGKKIEK